MEAIDSYKQTSQDANQGYGENEETTSRTL